MSLAGTALTLRFAFRKAGIKKKKTHRNSSYAPRHAAARPLIRKSISPGDFHVHTCCTVPGFGLPSSLTSAEQAIL